MTAAVVVIIVIAVVAVVAAIYFIQRGGGISHDYGVRYGSTATQTPVTAVTVTRPKDVGQRGSYLVTVVSSAPGVNIAAAVPPSGWTPVLSTGGSGLRVDTFLIAGEAAGNTAAFTFTLNPAMPAGPPAAPVFASATIVWMKNGANAGGAVASPSDLTAPAITTTETVYLLHIFASQTFAQLTVPSMGGSRPWVLSNPKAGDELDGHTHLLTLGTTGAAANPPLTATRPPDASGSTMAQTVTVRSVEYL